MTITKLNFRVFFFVMMGRIISGLFAGGVCNFVFMCLVIFLLTND